MFKNKTTVIDHMTSIYAKVLQAPVMASNKDGSSQGEDNNSTRAAVNVDQELPQLEECLDVKSKHISEINEQESPVIDRSTEEILTKQISLTEMLQLDFPPTLILVPLRTLLTEPSWLRVLGGHQTPTTLVLD